MREQIHRQVSPPSSIAVGDAAAVTFQFHTVILSRLAAIVNADTVSSVASPVSARLFCNKHVVCGCVVLSTFKSKINSISIERHTVSSFLFTPSPLFPFCSRFFFILLNASAFFLYFYNSHIYFSPKPGVVKRAHTVFIHDSIRARADTCQNCDNGGALTNALAHTNRKSVGHRHDDEVHFRVDIGRPLWGPSTGDATVGL